MEQKPFLLETKFFDSLRQPNHRVSLDLGVLMAKSVLQGFHSYPRQSARQPRFSQSSQGFSGGTATLCVAQLVCQVLDD